MGALTVLGVALGAGIGTRLLPFTRHCPKPLLPVLGRPILEYVVTALATAGATQVLVNVHHLAGMMATHLDAWPAPVPVAHAFEPRLRGPAGALLTFADALREADVVLVSSGDLLFSADLAPLVHTHRYTGAALTFARLRTREVRRYGVLDIDDDGLLISSREKPDLPDDEEHWVSGGIYAVAPDVVEDIARLCAEHGTCDYARELAPALTSQGRVVATHPLGGYWCDIGSPRALHRANLDALAGMAGPRAAASASTWDDGVGGEPVPVYVDARAAIGRDVVFRGPSVICGHAVVGNGCSLDGTVLLEGAELAPGTAVRGGLFGPAGTVS